MEPSCSPLLFPSCPTTALAAQEHHARSELRQGERQHIGGQDPADHLRPPRRTMAGCEDEKRFGKMAPTSELL